MEIVKVVEKSQNVKTGLVSATYAPIQSCPNSCPLKDNGCYGQDSFCGMYLRKISQCAAENKITGPRQIARIEAKGIKGLSGKYPLRLHVTGDCRSDAAVWELVKACDVYPNKVWTYTHAWREIDSYRWCSISVLASCETKEQCEEAYDKGYAPCLVTKESFSGIQKQGNLKYLVCPNITQKKTCVQCKMCFNSERLYRAGIVICFPVHGSKANKAKQKVE